MAKKVKCPECGGLFQTLSGLGSHRLKKHGVRGSSRNGLRRQPSAIKQAARELGFVEIVQRVYPKGIQTRDPELLLEDLRWIVQTAAKVRG